MGCCECGDETPLPDVKVSAEETYEFRLETGRPAAVNLFISITSSLILTFFLYLPSSPVQLSREVAIAISLGVAVACFLALMLPLFSREAATRVKISPRGIEIERRNGSSDNLTWSQIRGYVYQKNYYVFLTKGESVTMRIEGYSREQLATMRAAIRAPLAKGSLKWRGLAACSRHGAPNYPVIACLACILVGGALVHLGHRLWAGLVFAAALGYLAWAFGKGRRKKQ